VTTVRVAAPAKINLSLRIRSLRPDGYHELATVFHAVSLEDVVSIDSAAPGSGVTVTVTGEGAATVPLGDDNIVSHAAHALARHVGRTVGDIEVHINKSIPVAAGMAGGSADAAAALIGLCRLWDLDLTHGGLMPIAAQLGADVPFALMGGTALGTGRGDQLTPVLADGDLHWVIALSDAQLSTPRVYAEWDRLLAEGQVSAAGESADLDAPLLRALRHGDPRAIAAQLTNDLQAAAVSLHPSLLRVLDTGAELGALAGVVSGSGPTCAFLAEDRESAVALAAELAGAGVARGVRAISGPVGGAHVIA
jgi:4-diphosphocytidyl-2-C-methyl-D-erythritol kinase